MSDVDEEARDKLVANERIKFTATYANGLAVAIFAVGGHAALEAYGQKHGGAVLMLTHQLGTHR